jgi:Zn finger protein HypA/HybF involved in hydrogenase expression
VSVPFPHPTILPLQTPPASVWRACNACDTLFVYAASSDPVCPSCKSVDTKPSLGPITFPDTPASAVPAPAPPSTLSGIRRCMDCWVVYAVAHTIHLGHSYDTCPTCKSKQTELTSALTPPVPAPAFPKVFGTRLCLSCGVIYSVSYTLNLGHSYDTCTNCQSKNTTLPPDTPPVSDDPATGPMIDLAALARPRQMSFFTIPPTPKPTAWRIDSRWRKNTVKAMIHRWAYKPPDYRPEDQTWTVWSSYNITGKKAAENRMRLYRNANPFRQFRAVPVSWSLVPLINPFP